MHRFRALALTGLALLSTVGGVSAAEGGVDQAASAGAIPHMPMPIDLQRTANLRWLSKPVLASRLLDGMEDPSAWAHHGPGQMSFTQQRSREGKQSIRLVSATKTDRPSNVVGRPFGEAVLRRNVAGEDWGAYNRVSVWVYPTMNGHKIGSVVLKLFNDGVEKHPQSATRGPLHYALVKPGQWNHIVWEITHLSRDKVTGLELIYRLQGNEPGAAETVSFEWDQLELQKVNPDYFEGWAVAPGQIAFSHSGYEASLPKTALASDLKAEQFSLIDKTSGAAVLTKPIRRVKGELGEFQVLDFSEVRQPGQYILKAGDITTPPFGIGQYIWRDTILKTINFFFCERCGQAIEGIHDVCHQDWQAQHEGRKIVINGGWHDAGDLSQGLINTGEAVYAMFDLARSLRESDPVVSKRLIEEARWGLEWLHKTRFGDGYRLTWATMDYWTDGVFGNVDDTFGEVRNNPTDNFVAAATSAIASRTLKDIDPDLAAKSLLIARSDWQFAADRMKDGNVEGLGAGVLSSVEMYRATGEKVYADKAVELARLIANSQQRTIPDWQIPLTGYFYSSPRKDHIQNYMHRGHDQAPAVALAELCVALPDHPDWMQWYTGVALYSEYLRAASRLQEPYGTLPAGIYRFSGRQGGDSDQIVKGLKLSESHYLRRFPVWGDMRGHFGILLSQTKALAKAGRLRNRPELAELAHLQLQWVVGRNPFAQSTMYGEGYDYAPQYTAMSGDMVGSLPVGIQTRVNEDVPFWPVTNCWNYKEVWVHPSSRWLYTMADLYAPAKPASIRIDLAQQAAADGQVTIQATLRGSGQHQVNLRSLNLTGVSGAQSVTLQDGTPQTLTWTARIESPNTPWVAVLVPDGDLSQCRDLVGTARP